MASAAQYDYLIIGQGLAGSLLAWRLAQHSARVLVLDDGHATASSMVAAGLINPLAGMRFNHSPHVHQWLQTLEQTYDELAGLAGQPFLQRLDMVRLFRSAEQIRFYQRQKDRKDTHDLLGKRLDADHFPQPVHAPWGGFEQYRTGWVRLPKLLAFMTDWLRERNMLREEKLCYEDLVLQAGQLSWKEITADQVIFCDGYRSMHNPWFHWLPFAPDQGEILTLKRCSDAPLPDRIVNGATWLLPVDEERYRLGATHYHDRQDNRATEEGKQKLLAGMEALLRHPDALALEKNEAGVRPATADRQPFIGTHPELPRLHMFNGFGAHGSLTIPWYAQRMVEWLLQGKPLPGNADIRRRIIA